MLSLLMSCQSRNEVGTSAEVQRTIESSTFSEDSTQGADQPEALSLGTSCSFNAEIFDQQMGVGLVTVREGQMKPYNYAPVDSIVLIGPNKKRFTMKRYDLQSPVVFWGLRINNEPIDRIIKPFHANSEGQPNSTFIWKSGTAEDSNIIIQSFPDGKAFEVKNSSFFYLAKWGERLIESNVKLNKNAVIRKGPTDNSQPAEVSNGGYFTIFDRKEEWIQVAFLDPKDPSMEKPQQPCGWVKWYCNDSIRIEFEDNFLLEDYYTQ